MGAVPFGISLDNIHAYSTVSLGSRASKWTGAIFKLPKFGLRKNPRSRLMGKPTICICENKDADQLRGNREADQRLCFRYSDSTIPLLLKFEIPSLYLFSVLVQASLCRTCSETTLLVFPRGGSFAMEMGIRTLSHKLP